MNQNLKDEFHVQTEGTLLALRLIIAAIMKTHPEPDQLLSAIKELLRDQNVLSGNLPAPFQAAFDERVQEMTSHLYDRIQKK